MKAYRWYIREIGMSGVIFDLGEKDAKEEIRRYLIDEFQDMKFGDKLSACEISVWSIETDDDYHEAHPNCIAVNY